MPMCTKRKLLTSFCILILQGLYDSVVMAVSEILHFKYPNEPLQGHLALTEDPTTMMWVL